MKKHLISENGSFYKANLHAHSTFSDGKITPEEMKEHYVKNGYSVIAFSDHNVMLSHSELTDEDFLALTACEYDVSGYPEGSPYPATCHFNVIAPTPEAGKQLFWRREDEPEYAKKSAHLVSFDESEPVFVRKYAPECITEMMKKARNAGFFVTYNHPAWSHESYPQYMSYDGMHAMEIINTISNTGTGIFDYNDRVYDDMLRGGKRIFCIAADDNHNSAATASSRKSSLCKSYIMIKSERLDYPSVMSALFKGDFYASEGPVLNALWVEDGKLHVECAPTDTVIFTTYPGRGRAHFDETGDGLTHAEFTLRPDDLYVRVTLVDARGKRAYTNAYFTDEIIC